MSRGFRLLMTVALLVAGLLAVNVGTAQAATISQIISGSGEYQLRDHSEELLLRGALACSFSDITTTGNPCFGFSLQAGDKLVGVIGIAAIQQVSGPFTTLGTGAGAGATNSELTAVFSAQVVSTAACGTDTCITFGPSTAGIASDILAVSGVAIGAQPANTMGVFFEDAALKDFTTSGTRATVFGSATNGSQYWKLGQNDLVNNFWEAKASTLALSQVGSAGGFFNFGQNQLAGGSGPVVGVNTCQDTIPSGSVFRPDQFCGNGTVAASGNPANFLASDQTQISIVIAPVPEPASVVLMGTGLLGLAFARWRSRKRS